MKINWSGRSHKYSKKDIDYFIKVIRYADPLTQGKYLRLFENNFAKYIKSPNVLAVSSAASALEMIASSLNLRKSDEVIIPSHTYCASAIPFARNGAKIIWSDIDLKTRVVDLEDIKKKITKRTRAIVIVHLYGFAVDIKPIKKLCKKKNLNNRRLCTSARR